MDLKELKKIGLTDSEIKVYKALLKLGSSSVSNIQEETNIERRYIYDVINKLIDKGLVSYTVEKGKKTFQITHPNKILGYIDEQKAKLDQNTQQIHNILPNILKLYEENKAEIKVEILRGKEGVKALGEDMLNFKSNYHIGGNGSVQQYMPIFWKHYNKKRIKKKVMWHDLIIEGTLMETFKDNESAKKELKEIKYYKYKTIPRELGSPHAVSVYGDKIAMVLWSDSPFIIIIQNKDIAKFYLQHFKFLWKMTK